VVFVRWGPRSDVVENQDAEGDVKAVGEVKG
jgi:hypothetical protein